MTYEYSLRTRCVQAGIRRSQYGENAEALFLTQGYVYESPELAERRFEAPEEDEFTYSRYGNPTVRMFEDRMASIEGAEDAFGTASGMAAVNASLMCQLQAGDQVVSSRSLFGSCLYILEEILPRFGVKVAFVDGTDNGQWERAIRPGVKVVFLESISNPTLEVIDLGKVSELARHAGAIVVVDNVLSTPVFQNCFDHGADVVVYSTTKHIDGQGRCLGGVVLGSRSFIRKTFEPYLKHTGGSMSPFNAWVMLKGLETLDLRCRAQARTALRLARTCSGDSKLRRVIHPFLPEHPQFELATSRLEAGGTVLSLDFEEGRAAAFRFLKALRIVRLSNNLGDAKSLATHPATTTHQRLGREQRQQLGITDGLVRISVGLEDCEDLVRDFEQALASA